MATATTSLASHIKSADTSHELDCIDDEPIVTEVKADDVTEAVAALSVTKAPSADKDKAENSEFLESEYEVAVKLADLQGDSNSPLYSVKRFEDLGLSKQLLDGIYYLNFKKPSKIQERALPLLLSNPPVNMIGQSQSGTGKTAAFVLTILSRVDVSIPVVQALCLAPSRELARQIMGVIQAMGQFTNVKTQFAIPNSVKRGQPITAHVVVGTPGTVRDMIHRKQLRMDQLRIFVLDEADNMLDQQGLGDQCIRVKQLVPKTAQIVLFSATFPEMVVDYANKFAPNANQITLKQEELTVEGIRQLYMDCSSEEDKYRVLVELYHILTIGSSVIFVKKRDSAAEIQRRMEADGHKVAALHGALDSAERDRIMDEFTSGRAKVLIATNVLSRGIDVASVSMVVNYDLPVDQYGHPDPQTYLHRIGRTGRFGRVGVSVSFVHDHSSWSQLDQIQRFFNVPMTRVPTDDIDEVERVVKQALKSKKVGQSN